MHGKIGRTLYKKDGKLLNIFSEVKKYTFSIHVHHNNAGKDSIWQMTDYLSFTKDV